MESPDYKEQIIDEFKGNPLIEALPMINLDKTAIAEIEQKIEIRSEEQEYEPILRSMCIRRLNDLFVPLTVHFKLYKSVSVLIRRGYINRNFTSKSYEKMLYELHDLRKENVEINSYFANEGANHKAMRCW